MNKFAKLTLIAIFTLVAFSGCGGDSGDGGRSNPRTTYTVAVSSAGTGATGGGKYVAGATVSINAGMPPAEQQFKNWATESSGVMFANANSAVTTFVMPANAVTVTANFESISKIIEIWTPAELNDARNNLSGGYKLMADISLSSYANWDPIGSSDSLPFTGKINGDGYKITGLKINRTTAAYTGLFGYVKGGEIINLTLEDVNIAGGGDAGAIAGIIESGAITNCSVSGKIVSSSSVFSSSGGIAGSVWDNSVITDCRSAGEIIADDDAGGIVGSAYDSQIINSSSEAYIKSSLDDSAGSRSGGIAGYAENSEIRGCFNSGKVVSSSYGSRSGGIAGGVTHDSRIINSYNTGSIESYSDSDIPGGGSVSGGIAGYADDSEIRGCFNSGKVVSSSYDSSSGGIAGGVMYGGRIINSYNTGDIDSYSASDEPGRSVSGGIAGYVLNGTIAKTYSAGNTIISSSYSGGIAGSLEGDDTITDCAAIKGTINADHEAGRIAGYVYFSHLSIISNNFATADMTADGMADFDHTDARRHGVNKSDSELKEQTTYSRAVIGDGLGGLGWGFGANDNNPWKMAEPYGTGHPFLYWQ